MKFNSDIDKLKINGIYKLSLHSSYKTYILSNQIYNDDIENIIYNKQKMTDIITRRKNRAIIKGKNKIFKNLKSKVFERNDINEIRKKFRESKTLIIVTLNEETEPNNGEIKKMENELKLINKLINISSLDDIFKKIKHKEKEEMISLNIEAKISYETEG